MLPNGDVRVRVPIFILRRKAETMAKRAIKLTVEEDGN